MKGSRVINEKDVQVRKMAKNDEKRSKTRLFWSKEEKCPFCTDKLSFLMTDMDRAHKMALNVT